MKYLKIAFLLTVSLFITHLAAAQSCSIHEIGTWTNDFQTDNNLFILGQTFVACQTGNVTTVRFGLNVGTKVGTHNFRIGPSADTPTGLLPGPPYQTFTTVCCQLQTVEINLTTPFPVVQGNVYAIEMEADPADRTSLEILYGFAAEGDYPDGLTYSNFNNAFEVDGQQDYDFQVVIEPLPVPTLSDWALFLFGLILLAWFANLIALMQEAQGNGAITLTRVVFHPVRYQKALPKAAGLGLLGLLLIPLIWETLLPIDLFGTAIAVLLVAYVWHLSASDLQVDDA